ncbi:MAG: alpha/beta hydrolase family protein [Bifidobacteriaceae bacterium]|jgi:hypothetical protein|nr:alpha/beta hydrolase family protein [Bifidobacteriaceae bacterium]
MRLKRWAGWTVSAMAVAWLTIGAQMSAWAGERNGLVRFGSEVAPTAQFVMAGDGESLLAPGSDPDLRVMVDGDLATASHVAVLVPGVDTTPERFDNALARGIGVGSGEVGVAGTTAGARTVVASMARRAGGATADGWTDGGADGGAGAGAVDTGGPDWWKTMPGWARSLRLAAAEEAPGGMDDVAVVAWLGYVTPAGWAGAAPAAMKQGAANLAAFDEFLTSARPGAEVTWVCHSYGSLVCASALVKADPDALVLVGSPGVGVDKSSQLSTTARIWAGESGNDLISLTELVSLVGGSFGTRPSSPAFGALPLPCDAADGHSDYFRPGSAQVRTMASVVMGTAASGSLPAS